MSTSLSNDHSTAATIAVATENVARTLSTAGSPERIFAPLVEFIRVTALAVRR